MLNALGLAFFVLMFVLPNQASHEQIGSVLGKPVFENDLNKNVGLHDDLVRLFLTPVEEKYCQDQKIDPSEKLKDRISNEGARASAMPFVRTRVLHQHLFEKHGGRVLLTAFGPIAYDGYRKWMEERERAGEFEVTNEHYRDLLFEPLDEKLARFLTTDAETIRTAFDPTATERFIDSLAEMPAGAVRDPKHRLIGEVMGTPIYLNARYKDQLDEILYALILPRLEESYRKHHPEVEPTKADIKSLELKMRRTFLSDYAGMRESLEQSLAKQREIDPDSEACRVLLRKLDDLERQRERGDTQDFAARAANRKLQKHLYDTYGGGRVLLTPLDAIAFDAQRKWVEERERLGDFQIPDPEMRREFYKHWDNSVPRDRPRVMVDPDAVEELFSGYEADDRIASPPDNNETNNSPAERATQQPIPGGKGNASNAHQAIKTSLGDWSEPVNGLSARLLVTLNKHESPEVPIRFAYEVFLELRSEIGLDLAVINYPSFEEVKVLDAEGGLVPDLFGSGNHLQGKARWAVILPDTHLTLRVDTPIPVDVGIHVGPVLPKKHSLTATLVATKQTGEETFWFGDLDPPPAKEWIGEIRLPPVLLPPQ